MTSSMLTLLGWSVVLLLVQVVAQASVTTLGKGMVQGMKENMGPRDYASGPPNALAGRLTRALANLLETYPAFVALALGLAVAGKGSGTGLLGAQIWLVARVLYVPIYAAGIPFVRTLVWLVSVVGLVMMIVALLR